MLNQEKTTKYLKSIKPDFVIIAAAKVGGIFANKNLKADFIYQNIMIQTNLIHSSFLSGVKKLILLGSSCVYPKYANQPIKEEYLLSGALEETNDSYAIAKIAGIKMCESYNKQYNLDYICLMPTNLYGPNDNYDLNNSHFYPALISKIYDAKIKKKKFINIWGNGRPLRELLYVDDLADACIFFMKKKTKETLINIGYGKERSIIHYMKEILRAYQIKPAIKFDKTKPDGVRSKLILSEIAKSYGWNPKIKFSDGLKKTIKNFESKQK